MHNYKQVNMKLNKLSSPWVIAQKMHKYDLMRPYYDSASAIALVTQIYFL